MIYGIATVRDEEDIIAATLGHLVGQGVDRFLIVDHDSTDKTRSILETFPQVTVSEDHEPFHHHALRMTDLAHQAGALGATWIVPFDADEFWCTTNEQTIGDVLRSQPTDVTRVPAQMWQHIDRTMREPEPKPLPKMAFRYHAGIRVEYGNHDVVGLGGVRASGLLQVREIQYRSADHFAAKIRARLATVDPEHGPTTLSHIRRYEGWTREQLLAEWDVIAAKATVSDPIPGVSCISR